MVIQNNILVNRFLPELRLKYWMILLLSLVWLTRTSLKDKVRITLLLIFVHFLVNSIYLVVGAKWTGMETHNYSIPTIPLTLGYLSLITIFFVWFRNHKLFWFSKLSKLSINTGFLENDFRLLAFIYAIILLKYFVFEFFDFHIWINFLFTTSQKILAISGFESYVEPNILGGSNGSIYMSRDCLGFQTMLLFAVVVYLTGGKNRSRWIYIISGLLFLNFVNIMRFVLIFIHIQKHGGYFLAIEIHDMYNYIIYFLVFILWVIWFEKFGDFKKFVRNQNSMKADNLIPKVQ